GRTFNIYGVAPETDATYPVRVYVTTVGDWVTDTVDTDGITVYEDFVLTVGSGGDVPPTPPVTGPAWTLSGAINDALTELTGTVAFTYDGNPLNADLAVTVSVSDEAGAAVGTPAEVTLPAGATGTAVEFSIPAAYKTGTTYTLRAATGNTTYDVANTRPISKSGGGGDNRGGSGGGCDAGFGLFGLLAATGVVTLLRKKG
ncbi:MAG: SYNERG-CTERM sorting domain-containing protein, partial [Synergistaceae bacterium]|nr:SYNERG-CTERM sorting domain-containing protein [Synergistaceae bacterium]